MNKSYLLFPDYSATFQKLGECTTANKHKKI